MLKKRTKLYLTLFMAVILTATAVLALAQSTQSNKPKNPFESELDNELQTAITLNDEYMPQKKYTLIIGPNAALPEDPADGEEPVDPATPSDAEAPDPGTPSDAEPATPTDIVKPSVQAWRCDVGDTHRLALKALKYYYKTDATYTLTYDSAWLELLGTDTQYSTGELTEISNEPGKLVFTFDKEIPEGQTWTGLIALLNFKILQTGTTEVILQLDKEQPLPIVPVTEGVNAPDANVNLVDADHRDSVDVSSVYGPAYTIEKVFDGDLETRWQTKLTDPSPIVFTVTFKDRYAFNEIFISQSGNITSYELQYLAPGTTDQWITFHSDTTLGLATLNNFGKVVTTAMRIKMNKVNESASVGLRELQVRYMPSFAGLGTTAVNSKNADINLASIAYRESITSSTAYGVDYAVEYAADENTSTRWQSKPDRSEPEIITVVFKDVYAFNYAYIMENGNKLSSYELQYLKTDGEWETFYAGATLSTSSLDNFGEIVTKAVRLVMNKRNTDAFIGVIEFQVRYMPVPGYNETTPTNVQDESINLASPAYRQSVIVSSTVNSSYAVANAVDDNASTRWQSTTDAVDLEILTVTLKEVYVFNRIDLLVYGNGIASYELQYLKPSGEWETFKTGGQLSNTSFILDDFGEIVTKAVRMKMTKRTATIAISLYEFQIRYK